MRLTNIVFVGDLGCRIDLNHLHTHLPTATYDPARFSGLIWKDINTKCTYKIFVTGKMNCTGVSKIADVPLCMDKMIKNLRQWGWPAEEGLPSLQSF